MSSTQATRISTASRIAPVELRTPPALAAIARKFAPVVLQTDDAPTPASNLDYFGRMNMPANVELDSGNYFTIDVQFDTRFLQNYIVNHIENLSAEWNAKGHPHVTPLTMTGYCFTLFYAHLLGCDTYFRPTKSCAAQDFFRETAQSDLFNVLLGCKVPPFLADLLLEISPVYDPRRNNVLFCPSLAGYTHAHDFGRTLPPAMYYAAHQTIATTRTNSDVEDVYLKFFRTELVTDGTTTLTPSNYLGTWYGTHTHDNFVNRDFLTLFNPLVGRFLTQKPTFARTPFSEAMLDWSDYTTNVYSYMLLSDDDNVSMANTLYTALSTFASSEFPSGPTLGSILSSMSGTLLLSHSIEPPTLPTWTAATAATTKTLTSRTDAQFASDHRFLIEEPTYTGSWTWPDDESVTVPELYLVQDHEHDKSETPFKHVRFNKKIHVNPYVMYFQPYDVSPSSLALTIVAGLKIEHAAFTGFMVPIEDPTASLDDNNSQILNSALRARHLIPVNYNETAADNLVSVAEREQPDASKQSLLFSIISAFKSVLPRLDNSKVHLANNTLTARHTGVTEEDHHYSFNAGFNVKAGSQGLVDMPDHSLYGWSSYRFVHKNKNPTENDISFLLSFRTIYGSNVTLSRSKNPSLIIPH